MLTQGISARVVLGELRVRPHQSSMTIQSATPFESSQITLSPSQFSFQTSSVNLSISLDAINSELGFKRPGAFRSKYAAKSRSEGQSAVAQIVAQGQSDLNNPSSATVSKARSAAIYTASTQIAALPKARPSIQFSEPQPIQANFQKGNVSVSASGGADINFTYSAGGASLSASPRVDISLRNLDVFA